jgi:hypothetical protein
MTQKPHFRFAVLSLCGILLVWGTVALPTAEAACGFGWLDYADCRSGGWTDAQCRADCPDELHSVKQTSNGVPLIQPLDDATNSIPVDPSAPQATFINFFRDTVLQWLITAAVGIVSFWMVKSGVDMILAGGDQGKRADAKKHMVAAIVGLILLVFFGAILRALSAAFFVE